MTSATINKKMRGNGRPAAYSARKAEKAARDREIRSRMKGRAGAAPARGGSGKKSKGGRR